MTHPRIYAAILLFVAALLAWWSVRLARGPERQLVIPVGLCAASLLIGICGVLYLLFGSRCNDWEMYFVSTFNPDDVSWRQAALLVALVLAVLTFSTLLVLRVHRGPGQKPKRKKDSFDRLSEAKARQSY